MLKRTWPIFLLCALTVLSGCNKTAPPDLARHFEGQGVDGAFVLYRPKDGTYIRYNTERCRERFIPASTFKILNALIALETGAVADENEVVPWDGVDRHYAPWNRDHSLKTGMTDSVIWFYQELARRAGHERIQHYVDAVGYGNQDISGEIDSFWLQGGLRISPEEQIAFLQRLYENDLPFSARSIAIVKRIILLEETTDYRLSGKTGWASLVEPQVGWFVGYLERDGEVYFWATQVTAPASTGGLGQLCQTITYSILREMSLRPE